MSELARMAQEAQRQYDAGETEEGGFAPDEPMGLLQSIIRQGPQGKQEPATAQQSIEWLVRVWNNHEPL